MLQVAKELACPSLFYPDWGCWRCSLRHSEVLYTRALCWAWRMLWGHGWIAEEFLMSQSGVKYQDQDGEEGPDSLSAGFSFFRAWVQVGQKQTAFWGKCLMKFLTAGCGGGAACGCLLLPLLKEVEQMSFLGTDYAKKTSTFILEYWSRGKLNYKALKVAEGWGKRRWKLVAVLLPCDRCQPSCTSVALGGSGAPACLCGCCQACHCSKSALTEQEEIFMGFFSKVSAFRPAEEVLHGYCKSSWRGIGWVFLPFWIHLGLGNVDWQKCKV